MLGVSLGAFGQAVHDHCHAAAFLTVQQVHSISECIHHCHEVFSELWIVVVHVAAVEICYLLLECSLFSGRVLLEPAFEFRT